MLYCTVALPLYTIKVRYTCSHMPIVPSRDVLFLPEIITKIIAEQYSSIIIGANLSKMHLVM